MGLRIIFVFCAIFGFPREILGTDVQQCIILLSPIAEGVEAGLFFPIKSHSKAATRWRKSDPAGNFMDVGIILTGKYLELYKTNLSNVIAFSDREYDEAAKCIPKETSFVLETTGANGMPIIYGLATPASYPLSTLCRPFRGSLTASPQLDSKLKRMHITMESMGTTATFERCARKGIMDQNLSYGVEWSAKSKACTVFLLEHGYESEGALEAVKKDGNHFCIYKCNPSPYSTVERILLSDKVNDLQKCAHKASGKPGAKLATVQDGKCYYSTNNQLDISSTGIKHCAVRETVQQAGRAADGTCIEKVELKAVKL